MTLGLGKNLSGVGNRHHIERPIVEQLDQRLERDEPKVQRDADLAEILLIDGEEALEAADAVDKLDGQTAGHFDDRPARIAIFPSRFGKQAEALAAGRIVIFSLSGFSYTLRENRVHREVLVEHQLLDHELAVEEMLERLRHADVGVRLAPCVHRHALHALGLWLKIFRFC